VFGVLLHLLREIHQEATTKRWRQHGSTVAQDPKFFVVETQWFDYRHYFLRYRKSERESGTGLMVVSERVRPISVQGYPCVAAVRAAPTEAGQARARSLISRIE
jgi:hypothetical protein